MNFFVVLILAALCGRIRSRRLCFMVHKRYECHDGKCVTVRLCSPKPYHYRTYDLCKSKCRMTTASTNATETSR
ncbi:unnamed protein product [Cylicocyclus nassatus]|uniref:Uncharacterized protein n=1 Tax=Cylicocyclus nassatus TaxID=53992 RepID=A0AA36GJ84_CYLNA|nr:unnamed protein product [Cylicocyclus nassatus]